MFQNIQILKKNNYTINNCYYSESYNAENTPENEHNIISKNNQLKTFNSKHELEQVYIYFIQLGKMLYDELCNNIAPFDISSNKSIYNFKLNSLLNFEGDLNIKSNLENDNRVITIIMNWLNEKNGKNNTFEFKPLHFIEYCDDCPFQKVDVYVLCELSILSYMIISLLINQYDKERKKVRIYKNIEEILNNQITIDRLFTGKKIISMDDVLNYLINYIEYNDKFYQKGNIFKSYTKLSFVNGKVSFKYIYDNIYSFYWQLFKYQIYSIPNGFGVINICNCGNAISGKNVLCDECKRVKDALRKQEERKKQKIEKKISI